MSQILVSCLLIGLSASGCTQDQKDSRYGSVFETPGITLADPSLDPKRLPPASEPQQQFSAINDELQAGEIEAPLKAGAPIKSLNLRSGSNTIDPTFNGSLRGIDTDDTSKKLVQLNTDVNGQKSNLAKVASMDGVELDFEDTPLAQFLEQVVGGALNLNYIAPPNLSGNVNFHTAKPLDREELLSLVKNVLASNGLAIRSFNDVYYIASPDALKRLGENLQAGGNSDMKLRMIPVGKADARKIAEFIKPMLSSDLKIIPAPDNGVLFVRAGPSDIAQITELVNLVADSNLENQDVRIIPLTDSLPAEVSDTITKLYVGRGETNFIIIPLTVRSAVMVSSSDRQLLSGISAMVRKLDVSLKSSWDLRIIKLKNVPAKFAADQITAVFGGQSSGGSTNNGQTSSTNQQAMSQTSSNKLNTSGNKSVNAAPQLVPSAPKTAVDGEDGLVLEAQQPRVSIPVARSRVTNNDANNSSEQSVNSSSFAVSGSGSDEKKVTITPDERNNTLMVFSDLATFKRIKAVVQQMDSNQSQVIIEATVLEVELNDNLAYGVNWFLQNNISGASTNLFGGSANSGFSPSDGAKTSLPNGSGPGGAITFSNVFGGNAVKIVMTALQDVTNVKVISSPYLTVVDGKEASLQIGQEVPFATANLTAQNGAISQTITTKKTGIILKVTPKINGDDSVVLTIEQEVSSPDLAGAGATLTPTISTRNIKSDVITQSGSTIALGGLIQNKLNQVKSGVPVVSEIPIVGELFKQTTDNVKKTELLVLITTRVSRNDSEISRYTDALRNRLSK